MSICIFNLFSLLYCYYLYSVLLPPLHLRPQTKCVLLYFYLCEDLHEFKRSDLAGEDIFGELGYFVLCPLFKACF